MICKKCGCDTLIKNDDWYKCANCGAIIFDTEVKLGDMESPTKQVESIEKKAAYQKQQYTEQTKETDNVNQEAKEKSKLREAIDFCLPIVIAVIIAIILIFIATILPVAPFSDNQAEFETILGSTARVTIASMISYFVSQSWDIFVFHKLKDIFPNKKWIRNNVGTMTSQIIDTFIFIFIAFYGKVPSIVTMAISQYIVKFFLAILDTPIFYLLTKNNEKEAIA